MEISYCVEYAKTGRSSCKVCKKPLAENAMRLGKKSPSPFHDGFVLKWYHLACFAKKEKAKVEEVVGYDSLRPADLTALRGALPSGGAATTTATPATTVATGQFAAGDSAVSKYWALKDALDRQLAPKDLKAALEQNKLPTTGGRSTLVNRMAEAMFYGVATCPMCSQNDLAFAEGRYKCQADTNWGKCGWEGNAGVKIVPWETDKGSEFSIVATWTAQPHPRPVSTVGRKAVAEYTRDAKQPLRGMTFSAVGRGLESSPEAIRALVSQNGGSFYAAGDLHPDVDYVLCTYGELVRGKAEGVAKARSLGLALVSELLLPRLLEEFGFDQRPYLFEGNLPPIALAKASVVAPAAPAPADAPTESKDELATKEAPAAAPAATVKRGHVDPDAMMPKAVVYREKATEGAAKGFLYDMMLIQTDITAGFNKYYKLQLLDTDGTGKKFTLFTKWGRVGTPVGASTKSPVGGLAAAIDAWAMKFKDKTGNEWSVENVKNFVKKPGKYFVLEFDEEEEDEKDAMKAADEEDDGLIPSYLDPKVQNLIRLMFDTNMMASTLKELEVDVKKMPLGKISPQLVQKGYTVLKEIEQVLNRNDPNSSSLLLGLSSQFYTLVPHDFGRVRPPLLDTFDKLKRKMAQLDALMDIQIANKLLQSTDEELTRTHPLDRNYKKLGVDISPLSNLGREWKLVNKLVTNGWSPSSKVGVKVLDAFRVSRPDEHGRFEEWKDTRPRKLLWHGSRLCNYVGILNQGLRIAPPEAPTTGYMFGKGIYLADMVEKSASFCFPSADSKVGLLLLCDVALGHSFDLTKPQYVEKLPDGKLSTHALSKFLPDPAKDETGDEEVIIPAGPAVMSNLPDVFLEHGEYVVYKESQIKIKYLVKVQFV